MSWKKQGKLWGLLLHTFPVGSIPLQSKQIGCVALSGKHMIAQEPHLKRWTEHTGATCHRGFVQIIIAVFQSSW